MDRIRHPPHRARDSGTTKMYRFRLVYHRHCQQVLGPTHSDYDIGDRISVQRIRRPHFPTSLGKYHSAGCTIYPLVRRHTPDRHTRVATRTRLKMNQPDGGRFHISQIDCDSLQTYYRLDNKVTRSFEAMLKYQGRKTMIFCPSAKYAKTQSRRRSYRHWRRKNTHLACEQSRREDCSNPQSAMAGRGLPDRADCMRMRPGCIASVIPYSRRCSEVMI